MHFIRDTPGLTGTHWGCDTSNCGACVVLMDGQPVKSCTHAGGDVRRARDAHGRVARGGRRARSDPAGLPRDARPALRVLHAGDADDRPGAAGREPDPTEHEIRVAISGSICRCTGYKNIVSAVRWAAEHEAPRQAGGVSDGHHRENLPSPTRSARSASAASSARRTRASSAARAPTWMTSACRGCCTARSCAARTRTRASSPSTPRKALAHPNVAAVVTAKDLETLGLAWMPTISYDTQAVLAGDKVRFQGQEVAFVIATDEYSARRRAAADRRRVRAAAGGRQRPQGARPRRAADPRRQGRPARQPGQPDLGGRRRGGHRPRLRRGRHGRQPRHHLPALPPGAAGDVRDDRRLQPADRPARHLQRQPGAARAPHRLRARRRAAPST